MFYSTRHESLDEPQHSKRQPHPWLIQHALSSPLRRGLILQLIALTGLTLCYYAFQGRVMFTFDLHYTTHEMRENLNFRVWLAVLSGVYALGAVLLMSFQVLMADDACWARGYRAGSKLLARATFLDVLSSVITFVFFLRMASNYDQTWWNHFSQGGVEWTFLMFARLLHGCALVFYGIAFLLLEVYHEHGTNDWHGVVNFFMFGAAGVAAIVVLFLLQGIGGILLLWGALLSALLWAMSFEQELNETSPKLNETELTNDVEQQVEKFARMSPAVEMPAVHH